MQKIIWFSLIALVSIGFLLSRSIRTVSLLERSEPSPVASPAANRASDQLIRDYRSADGMTRCVFSADTGDRGGMSIIRLADDLGIKCLVIAGDVVYPNGSEEKFHEIVEPYVVSRVESQDIFVTPGNHDWWKGYPVNSKLSWDPDELPLCSVFPYLPSGQGKCRYYRVLLSSDVEVFFFDSDIREPDGNTADSVQGLWLKNALSDSKARWKIVVTHETPVSSCDHEGSLAVAHLPLKNWGADALVAGHCHQYERSDFHGLPLFVVGVGGESRYEFEKNNPYLAPSDQDHTTRSLKTGALVMSANNQTLKLEFKTLDQNTIDSLILPLQN